MTPLVLRPEQDRGVVNSDTHSYAAPLRRFRVNQIVTCEATEIYLRGDGTFSLRSRYAFERDVSRIDGNLRSSHLCAMCSTRPIAPGSSNRNSASFHDIGSIKTDRGEAGASIGNGQVGPLSSRLAATALQLAYAVADFLHLWLQVGVGVLPQFNELRVVRERLLDIPLRVV